MILNQLDEVNITTILDIAKRIKNSPLTPIQMSDLAVSDGLGREPQIDINGERIESTPFLRATTVIEEIGGSEVLENREYDA